MQEKYNDNGDLIYLLDEDNVEHFSIYDEEDRLIEYYNSCGFKTIWEYTESEIVVYSYFGEEWKKEVFVDNRVIEVETSSGFHWKS